MVLSHPTLSRLTAVRPVLLGSDPRASLAARGVDLRGPAALARLLREEPALVREHYDEEIASGVDVLVSLTGETLPRALQQLGMPFRAAALTGDAVELALAAVDAGARPVVVAGVLGDVSVPPLPADRVGEEIDAHVARLTTAGCEMILVRGLPSLSSRGEKSPVHDATIALARRPGLAAWAVIAIGESGLAEGGRGPGLVAREASAAGAEMIVFEVSSVERGVACLDELRATGFDGHVGFALAAGGLDPESWAGAAVRLADQGAAALGGGRGATWRHVEALASRIGATQRAFAGSAV